MNIVWRSLNWRSNWVPPELKDDQVGLKIPDMGWVVRYWKNNNRLSADVIPRRYIIKALEDWRIVVTWLWVRLCKLFGPTVLWKCMKIILLSRRYNKRSQKWKEPTQLCMHQVYVWTIYVRCTRNVCSRYIPCMCYANTMYVQVLVKKLSYRYVYCIRCMYVRVYLVLLMF